MSYYILNNEQKFAKQNNYAKKIDFLTVIEINLNN